MIASVTYCKNVRHTFHAMVIINIVVLDCHHSPCAVFNYSRLLYYGFSIFQLKQTLKCLFYVYINRPKVILSVLWADGNFGCSADYWQWTHLLWHHIWHVVSYLDIIISVSRLDGAFHVRLVHKYVVVNTARILCSRAYVMVLCPSICCPSLQLLQQVCCCGPHRQAISISCGTTHLQQARPPFNQSIKVFLQWPK